MEGISFSNFMIFPECCNNNNNNFLVLLLSNNSTRHCVRYTKLVGKVIM